jgi:putative ABC transport system permease protein
MADARRFYRMLLKLYPARFREEYGKPLERQFRDEYEEIEGGWPRAWFWFRALTDLAMSIPVEFARELRRDAAYALRVYRQRSVATVLTLVALALTIGIATGVFSVVNALLLRSLPFRDPDALVEARGFYASDRAELHEWTRSRPYFEEAAAFRTEQMSLTTKGEAWRVNVAETSSTFFRLLGSQPLIGRAFADDEDTPGHAVAIVSYALWEQLGGDPRILGSTIRINGEALTVIGVGPQGLDYPNQSAVWVPTVFQIGYLSRATAITRVVDVRLKPGVALPRAQDRFRADLMAYQQAHGASPGPATRDQFPLVPLRDQLAGNVRRSSTALLGLVVFVLLTACANLAHLLLSRVTERRKELMLRAAMGASQARLTQQLITETSLLTLVAAGAGLLVAGWAARLAASIQPPSLETQAYRILDMPVLLFAVGIALLTGVVFGVLPAGLIRRMQPRVDPLRVAAGGQTTGVEGMRAGLVALQAALTVMLLAGAFTMCGQFLKLSGADLGLRTDHAVVMNVALAGTPREAATASYYRDATARLRAIPGVEAAGAAEVLPLETLAFVVMRFRMEGDQARYGGTPVAATRDYLRAIGTPIVAGRDFTAEEEAQSKPVAIVNEAFARQFDPSLGVIGKRLIPQFGKALTIVGVAKTQRFAPGATEGYRLVYHLPGWSQTTNMTLVARVRGAAALYEPVCRDAVRGIDSQVPVFRVGTLDGRLRDTLSRPRFFTWVVLFFSALALLLAVIGIYGVAAFSIEQRRHEIGVRLAVGAPPGRLRASLVRRGLFPVLAGLVVGVVGATTFGNALEGLMAGVESVGFAVCAGAALALAVAAGVAVWTATRRIVGMDPLTVLRAE